MRALAIVVWVVVSVPLMAQTEPRLEAHGAAEVRVPPDLAVVRLGVASEAATAREAQEAVNSTSNVIRQAVRDIGIADQNVSTVRVILSPIYASGRPDDRRAPRIVGYRAANTVSVRTDDLSLVAPVIDAALDAGANQLDGVSFHLQDDRIVMQQALREAVEEARAKAEAMADALGLSLGALVTVTEDSGLVVVQGPMLEMSRATAVQSDTSTPVSPGEVSVSASVTVEYRLATR